MHGVSIGSVHASLYLHILRLKYFMNFEEFHAENLQ
jgi:hypothetical protein